MKKYLFIILLALVSLSGQAKKHKQLVILHTNDTHSAILPINEQLPDTMKAGRGGFLRRIAMLKEERAKHPDLLYFDSGDFFQGSAYFTMFKGDVEVGLMNLMGLDATTIGQTSHLPYRLYQLRFYRHSDGRHLQTLDRPQAQWLEDRCLCCMSEDERTCC